MEKFTRLEKKETGLYDLPGFEPLILTPESLKGEGIDDIDSDTENRLFIGSLKFVELYRDRKLECGNNYTLENSVADGLEFHNYTGLCPKNVLEVSPSAGSCSISCLYCLVSDGSQEKPIRVYQNYPDIVSRELERRKDEKVFFYFSPKTEAFSEPLLESGVSHEILRRFIEHYENYPDSKARLFIASKAGTKHLNFENKGDKIIDLLEWLSGKVQFHGSVGIMPDFFHNVLEPNAPSVENRLEAMELCRDRGIYAYSVLSQPIIPCFLSEELANTYMRKMKSAKIINVKPEFLTTSMENIAIISQYVNHFDKSSLADFLRSYVSLGNRNHIKQRSRTAPDREISSKAMGLISKSAERFGIGVSICNWVKSQLNLDSSIDKASAKMGFKCLGYQENLFDHDLR
jgi:DNA repair photolyase